MANKRPGPVVPSMKDLANKIGDVEDADVLILNFGIEAGFEHAFIDKMRSRKHKRKKLIWFLTTEGGDPDSAFRIARCAQDCYDHITIVVGGWCKSAGTLICVAANDLVICEKGELGPLDIQIAKPDEMWERNSGLAVNAAFEKLQEESFNLFLRHLLSVKSRSSGRITFKTAADIAAQMAIGVTAPIFSKLDPLTIGEEHRASIVCHQYAQRLNLKAKNLKRTREVDGLEMLLNGYPSHGFVIDRKEADDLFNRVLTQTGHITELINAIGRDAFAPRSRARGQLERLEYLNDETKPQRKAGPAASRATKTTKAASKTTRASFKRNGSGNLSGHIS